MPQQRRRPTITTDAIDATSMSLVPVTTAIAEDSNTNEVLAEYRQYLKTLSQANIPHIALPNATYINSRQRVEISRVWENPLMSRQALKLPEEEFNRHLETVNGVVRTLRKQSQPLENDIHGVLHPVIVTPWPKPGYAPVRTGDYTNTLMLVAGDDEYYSAMHRGENMVDVQVVYFDSFANAAYASVISTTIRYEHNPYQIGLKIKAYKEAHRLENEGRKTNRLPLLDPLEDDAELAPKIGFSAAQFSVYQRCPDQPQQIIQLIQNRTLGFDDMQTILAIADEKKRLDLALRIAAAKLGGKPMTRKQTRQAARKASGRTSVLIAFPEVDISDLMITREKTRSSTVILALSMYDSFMILEKLDESGAKLPREIKTILNALREDNVQTWLDQVTASIDEEASINAEI